VGPVQKAVGKRLLGKSGHRWFDNNKICQNNRLRLLVLDPSGS
jgi:hypothetical protein